MSLKKFMHPKNKYREKPNFKQLAIKYPEFRDIAITELTGAVKINFKDERALRVLTQVLLKHDFNLDIKIPSNKLVPALPLRLNYILWIEDILMYGNLIDSANVHGLDIGTGAICIYPLLIAKLYGWQMTASEIDVSSVQSAIENISRNNMQHLISVTLVNENSILEEVLEENKMYTFVMCNPPFFEIDNISSMKLKQNPPRNAPTGNGKELAVEGGEQNFISRLIEDSLKYKDQVKVYTTMFGQKRTLSFIKKKLFEKNITNSTWTEFCQGHTKRWGLTWTFLSEDILNLKNAPVIRTRSIVDTKRKGQICNIDLPVTESINSIEKLAVQVEQLLTELNVKISRLNLKDNNVEDKSVYSIYRVTAFKDSWSHARRKRRMAVRAEENAKKIHLQNDIERSDEAKLLDNEEETCNFINLPSSIGNGIESSSVQNEGQTPYLLCKFVLQELQNVKEDYVNNKYRICMFLESGNGGKNGLESLRQYLINKLNVREYFIQQQTNKVNKPKKRRRKKKVNLNSSNKVNV